MLVLHPCSATHQVHHTASACCIHPRCLTDLQDMQLHRDCHAHAHAHGPAQVRLHSVQGKQLPGAFSLGAEVAKETLSLAATYADGLAAITAETRTVWAVAGLQVMGPASRVLGWRDAHHEGSACAHGSRMHCSCIKSVAWCSTLSEWLWPIQRIAPGSLA